MPILPSYRALKCFSEILWMNLLMNLWMNLLMNLVKNMFFEMILDNFAAKMYLKKCDLKTVMTEKQCSTCKCIKAMEHFEKGEGEYIKTCDVCRESRQRHDEKQR